jgi:hypothetical protein
VLVLVVVVDAVFSVVVVVTVDVSAALVLSPSLLHATKPIERAIVANPKNLVFFIIWYFVKLMSIQK